METGACALYIVVAVERHDVGVTNRRTGDAIEHLDVDAVITACHGDPGPAHERNGSGADRWRATRQCCDSNQKP
jgi:hypothetical protein